MARILILFAHPALEKSRIHRQLVPTVNDLPNVTFHDLYEAYPTFNIDIDHEQALMLAHDIIVLQHPFYWYSTPSLMKQWEDLVLEHGWAYGSKGTALRGKQVLSALSTGGGTQAYQRNGYNRYTIRELLAPMEQTAVLCKMNYLSPFVIFGTHRMEEADIQSAAASYQRLIIGLRDEQFDLTSAAQHPHITPQMVDTLLTKEATI